MVWCLALDQAGKAGWALGSDQGEHHRSGMWNLPSPNEFGDELPVFLAMRRRLTDLYAEQPFDLIAYEEPQAIEGRFRVGDRIQLLGIVAIAQVWAYDHGIKAFSVSLKEWRGHFVGAQYAPRHINVPEMRTKWWKEKAIEACTFRMWDCHGHHDEAEARGILDYALAQVSDTYFSKVRPSVLRQKSHIEKEGAY